MTEPDDPANPTERTPPEAAGKAGAPGGGSAPSPSGGGGERQGVTIPGYQPVELLGATPSYGAWVRAIQVRMDRRVLLKVLKPDLPLAHEYFGREIQAVVRLDGDGVLRAIDEGTVRGFRYLVVDEAEGIPLSASVIGGEEGWRELTRTALELWRRILERHCVLLPFGVDSWRRLPAGDFATADLGWLVPLDEEAPEHPRVPAAVQGRPLRAHDAIRTFEAAGKSYADELGIPLPAPWRRAVQFLSEIPEDAQFEDVLRALADAKGAVDPPRTKQLAATIVGGVLVVAALVWGTIHFTSERDPGPDPAPDTARNETSTDPGTTEPDVSTEPTEEELLARAEAERREAAWEAYLAIVPDVLPDDAGELPPFLPLPDEKVAALRSFTSEYAGTEPETHARAALEWHETALAVEVRTRLARTIEQVDLELSLGRVAQAEAAWGEFVPQLEKAPESLRTALAVATDSVVAWIDRVGVARVAALTEKIEAARDARRFRSMAVEVGRAVPTLRAADRSWGEEQRLALIATADRYEQVRDTIAARVRTSGDRAEAADFAGAVAAIAPVPGEEEFPELANRRAAWERVLEDAHAVARAIRTELGGETRADRAHDYAMRDGDEVRGRIVSTTGIEFTVKLDGRRTERTISWLDLAPEQWAELAGGGLAEERRLLVESLLGREAALESASALEPPPAWTVEVRRRLQRAANAGLERLLTAGRAAHQAGRHAEAHEAARSIVTTIPPDIWEAERDALEEWCRSHWEAVGPGEEFPGATVTWAAGRRITIATDFSDEESTRGWIAERPGGGSVRRSGGGMLVQGSVWLAPGGDSDLFEGALTVKTEVIAAVASAPNVNILLFARAQGDHGVGDLFALGFKPPAPLAQRIDGDIPVFLPANVIGPIEAAERGRGRRLVYARSTPKVPAGKALALEVRSAPEGLSLGWRGTSLHEEPFPRSGGTRLGTVQFRSYTSALRIDEISIEGRISEPWWQRWVGERVDRDLDPTR